MIKVGDIDPAAPVYATCSALVNGERRGPWRMRVAYEVTIDPLGDDIIKEAMKRQIIRRHPGCEVAMVGEVRVRQ